MHSTKYIDVNCAPLSDITCSGIPCSENKFLSTSIFLAVVVCVTSTTSAHLFINGQHNRCGLCHGLDGQT